MPNSDQTRWFAREVQPHEPMLRAYLQREFPTLPDVDDIVQESHLRLLRAHEKSPIKSGKAYLFTVARNVAFGLFRRQRVQSRVTESEVLEIDFAEAAGDAAESASRHQEFQLAVDAIEHLPGRCREIVILRALRGLSHKEIAEKLHLSEQTVRVQVARGMKKCAQFLRDRGIAGSRPHDE